MRTHKRDPGIYQLNMVHFKLSKHSKKKMRTLTVSSFIDKTIKSELAVHDLRSAQFNPISLNQIANQEDSETQSGAGKLTPYINKNHRSLLLRQKLSQISCRSNMAITDVTNLFVIYLFFFNYRKSLKLKKYIYT